VTVESDLSAQSQYSVNEANSQSGAVASVTASVKTAGEVKAEFDYYVQFAPKRFPKSVHEATSWGVSSLEKYAKQNGKQWGHDVIEKVASAYGYNGYIPSDLPHSAKEAETALVNIGCSAAAMELGVDPKLAVVTVDAIMDGKLDSNDCEAIGKTAGAIAGAAICQAYGIPAPIGAFLGGEIGGFVGGEVAKIFGLSDRAYKKWLAEQKRIVAQLQAAAEQQCHVIREGYWQSFDTYVVALEQLWEELELKTGHKFQMRWFDRALGQGLLPFVEQQPKLYPPGFLSDQICATVCEDGWTARSGTAPYLTSKEVMANPQLMLGLSSKCREHYIHNPQMNALRRFALKKDPKIPDPKMQDMCGRDCLAQFGCLYPDLEPYVKYAPSDPGLYSSTRRAVAAYRALGFVWKPPPPYSYEPSRPADESRQTYCQFPAATSKEIKDKKYRALWTSWLATLVNAEQLRIAQLNSVSVKLAGDLTTTAAMVAAQVSLSDAKTRAAAVKSLTGTDVTALSGRNSLVNNGALAGGLGVLGYSFWSR
jgi:hypothetical protein